MSFIVIDGLDGSGKGTQIACIQDLLEQAGESCIRLNFPNYASSSSSLVKMYLGGDFGENPKAVNPYAACTFYAVDRFASYKQHWQKELEAGKVILADRYTTSNIIYQMTKLPSGEWDDFILWIENFEYKKMGLPQPDCVVYLDMPPEISQKLISKRYGGDDSKKDIHEKDLQFLLECRACALYAVKKLGWKYICCAEDGVPKSIEAISKEIMKLIEPFVLRG